MIKKEKTDTLKINKNICFAYGFKKNINAFN